MKRQEANQNSKTPRAVTFLHYLGKTQELPISVLGLDMKVTAGLSEVQPTMHRCGLDEWMKITQSEKGQPLLQVTVVSLCKLQFYLCYLYGDCINI